MAGKFAAVKAQVQNDEDIGLTPVDESLLVEDAAVEPASEPSFESVKETKSSDSSDSFGDLDIDIKPEPEEKPLENSDTQVGSDPSSLVLAAMKKGRAGVPRSGPSTSSNSQDTSENTNAGTEPAPEETPAEDESQDNLESDGPSNSIDDELDQGNPALSVPGALENFIALGARDPGDARRIMNDFNSMVSDGQSRLNKLTNDGKNIEAMRNQLLAESAHQAVGGGGGLGLLSSLTKVLVPSKLDFINRDLKGNISQRQAEAQRISGDRKKFENQLAANIAERLTASQLLVAAKNTDLLKSIHEFNRTYLESKAATPLREALLEYAKNNNLDVADLAGSLSKPNAPSELKALRDQLNDSIMADSEVKSAADRMEKIQKEMLEHLDQCSDRIESLQKLDDPEFSDHAKSALDTLESVVETQAKPIDPEKAEEMNRRFREMMESISEFVKNIMSAFGRK